MPKNYTKDELENGRWVTMKGARIFIKDGESPEDAFSRAMNKQPENKTVGQYEVKMPETYMSKEDEKKNKSNAKTVQDDIEKILKQYPDADEDKVWEALASDFPFVSPYDNSVIIVDNNGGVYDKDAKIGSVQVSLMYNDRLGKFQIKLFPSYDYMDDLEYDDEDWEALGIHK